MSEPEDPLEVGEGPLSKAWQVADRFVWKIRGHPDYAHERLEDLVTPETLALGDVDATKSKIEGLGMSRRVRYLDPERALVLLIRLPAGVDTFTLEGPTVVEALGLLLRYYEGERTWRVQEIVDPNDFMDPHDLT